MRKIYKCIAKETGYHLTQGKNYEIDLAGKNFLYHTIENDIDYRHYITDDDLKYYFVDLEKMRCDKLELLLK